MVEIINAFAKHLLWKSNVFGEPFGKGSLERLAEKALTQVKVS